MDFTTERLEEQSFDRCDHNSLQTMSWMCSLRYTCMTYMALDRHRHWSRSKRTSSQKIRLFIWTVNEVGTRYEHLKRRRVLYNDRPEIVPNAKYLRVVLHNMGLTNCKPAPTPSVAGSIDDDADLDMQECRLYLKLLGVCSTCLLIAVTCISRRTLAQRRSSMRQTLHGHD